MAGKKTQNSKKTSQNCKIYELRIIRFKLEIARKKNSECSFCFWFFVLLRIERNQSQNCELQC